MGGFGDIERICSVGVDLLEPYGAEVDDRVVVNGSAVVASGVDGISEVASGGAHAGVGDKAVGLLGLVIVEMV